MPHVCLAALAAGMALNNAAWSQQARPDPYKTNPFLGTTPTPGAEPRRPDGRRAEEAIGANKATTEAIAAAQAEMAKPRTEPGYKVPRLAIGQPDLQGVWSNASNTRLTRPAQFASLVMNDEQAAKARREQGVWRLYGYQQ